MGWEMWIWVWAGFVMPEVQRGVGVLGTGWGSLGSGYSAVW